MSNTNFHPNSDVPTTYKVGRSYDCQACGSKKSLYIDKNSEGVVIAKCYGDDCYL